MPGSIIGYHKANFTKNLLQNAKEESSWESEIEKVQLQSEIRSNFAIWKLTLGYLKKLDPEDTTPILPKDIRFTGDYFQKVLGDVWNRINFIKSQGEPDATK